MVGGIEIASEEGTTQGDPTAKPVYALAVRPLLLCLAEPVKPDSEGDQLLKARQAAYADDLAGCGTIDQLRVWWDIIIKHGPFLGYHAKPSKSWLIVKPQYEEYARKVFENTGIQITTSGKRHLGAVVGTQE